MEFYLLASGDQKCYLLIKRDIVVDLEGDRLLPVVVETVTAYSLCDDPGGNLKPVLTGTVKEIIQDLSLKDSVRYEAVPLKAVISE